MSRRSTKIPPGLVRVRKPLPPPGRVFKSKKTDLRTRAKEKLRRALKEILSPEVS